MWRFGKELKWLESNFAGRKQCPTVEERSPVTQLGGACVTGRSMKSYCIAYTVLNRVILLKVFEGK
jgi:hypothetical protein